jgi:uncharacterized DUF497 family protein
MRFRFDKRKSALLKANRKRGIGFEEVVQLWEQPHYVDQRSEVPEQFRAIGWIQSKLYSVIYEVRNDDDGEYLHLVTLWKATREEREIYENNE